MKRLFVYAFLAFYPLCGSGQTVHLPMPAADTTTIFRHLALKPVPSFKPASVPANLYTQNFGFFCRQELKMYKANVPVSFRLGSMEYCDRLEGKGKK